jgi:hypothetical protein
MANCNGSDAVARGKWLHGILGLRVSVFALFFLGPSFEIVCVFCVFVADLLVNFDRGRA